VQFKKGHSKIEGSGIKKGEKQKKTLAWEAIGDYIVSEGAERLIKILAESTDVDFIKNYAMLLEYFKPKLARTEMTADIEGEVTIIRKVIDGRDKN